MTTYPMSPLIARAFADLSPDQWSDGAPLLDPARCLGALVWPAPADELRVTATNAARSVAAQAREADILAMRAAGASLRTIRDALGYASVNGVSTALARAQRRQEEA